MTLILAMGCICEALGQNPPAKTPEVRTRRLVLKNPLNDLLEEAQRDIDKKDFEAAIAPLQKFIAEQPEVAYGHFQLGYVFTALRKIDEARAEYERAVALDPKMTEGYLNLGVLLIERDSVHAVIYLKKAVEMLPEQSRPRYLLGVAEEKSGDDREAAVTLEGAYRLDPHGVEIGLHLGDLYLRRLKRPVDAEGKYRSVLETQPNNAGALLGVAESLDEQKKPQAAEAYRRYLTEQPEDARARARLVHLLAEGQQYDAALAELEGGAHGSVDDLELLRLRGDVLVAQKKWDEAIATIRKAVELAPNDAELHGGLGRLYLQKRDFVAAEKELKSALQLNGKNLNYWKDLSTAYYLSGDCGMTLAALDEIAKAETPGAGPWFIRALCYDKLKQLKPALEAYQKFLSLDHGQNANQEWQAQERSKVLRRELEHKR